MAVTKIRAIHDSVSRVVEYCSNPEKTKLTDPEQVLIYAANKKVRPLDEGEQSYAVSCVNCRPIRRSKEMTATQKRFGKTGGNVAYHAYQSFKTGEVSAAECHRSAWKQRVGSGATIIKYLWQRTSIREPTTITSL